MQIYEEEKAGKGDYTSALNPFKSLEQLVTASVEALAAAMRYISEEYDMSYDESLTHAVAFVGQTTGPLVGKLDPDKLGQYNRGLSVAAEYGRRLLARYRGLNRGEASKIADRLVYGYPSHEYIIDYNELSDLGFSPSYFDDQAAEAGRNLLPIANAEERVIKLVEPVSSTDESGKTSEADIPLSISENAELLAEIGIGQDSGENE